MSVEELLSQDEIDVLLNGVDEGQVETQAPSAPMPTTTHYYDFAAQDHIVRGRMPTLEMINERFSRYSRASMFNLLRETTEVNAIGIESIKFSEYLQTLSMPTSINMIKMSPLRGTALLVMDSQLVVRLVDKFFGGGKREINVGEREFTGTEQRMIQKMIEQVFIDMKEAWKTVMQVDFQYTGSEANPAMVNMISSSEVVVVSTYEFELSDEFCKLQLVIPYSTLEPVRESLDSGVQADVDETDEHWLRSLREDIMYASVPLNCRVAQRKITLREILNFKVGDVIPIEMPDTSPLVVNGIPIFETRLGTSNDHLALKIVRQIKQPR